MDKCPFCGAGLHKQVVLDIGKNLMAQSRAEDVYKMQSELNSLKPLIREMGKILQPLCGGFWPGEDPHKVIDKGTEILARPEVKAILEEK